MEYGDPTKKSTITLDLHLGVSPEQLEEAGVLNVILGVDTKLFIDSKLIEATDIPEFQDARQLITGYFDKLLRVNAQFQATGVARLRDIVVGMIAIKEPVGLAIGYGNSRDSGTSIAETVAEASLHSVNEMISVGVNDLEVMEMLGLFIKKFGSDSMSDLIAHIIYAKLCAFTQRVCQELGVATERFEIDEVSYKLPRHPFDNHQVVFVPLNLLSPLPLATSWQEVSIAAQINANSRRNFNQLVGKSIRAFTKKIKDNPSLLAQSVDDMRTVLDVYKNAVAEPYDINNDIKGYYRLAQFASKLQRESQPVRHEINSADDLIFFIQNEIVPKYRRHIEQLGANELLYKRVGKTLQKVDPTKPVHEEVAQILFHTIADDVCAIDDVMVTRESKTGVGAVDFTLGRSYSTKVVVEIKKSSNKNLLEGYTKQIERYIKAENAAGAFYVVVVVRGSDQTNEKSQLNRLLALHTSRIDAGQNTPHLVVVNGLIRLTASQVHGYSSEQGTTASPAIGAA